MKISTRKVAIAPARLTASAACRGVGLTGLPPLPWASPTLLRRVPRLFTKFWHPPRIDLKTGSVCWLGARVSLSATIW